MTKRWVVQEKVPVSFVEGFPELHPVLLQLLWNRNIRTQEDVDVFLSPDWSRDMLDPSLFSNMTKAVKRTFDSLENKETITIHGDYDADGVCGSAVLVSTLREIARKLLFNESKIDYYIPHREKEGYGLSISTVEQLIKEKETKLIITVDCGISNKSAIDFAKKCGIDTIVCDHHTMPKELPEKAILIHPLVPGETFPNKFLCGTAVAFKFASALLDEARNRGADIPSGHEKWLLDLVAIATVTDMVPIVGENRVLEHFGLKVLNKTKRPGLCALINLAGAEFGKLDTTSIGFLIGPRLNAAGRMDHAYYALELLVEEDETLVLEKAERLQDTNKARQIRSEEMYKDAKKQLVESPTSCIILWQEGWQAGLVGLVAGKLLNEYNLPTFIFGKDGDRYVGSGRSNGLIDLMPVLHSCAEFFEKYGGHPQACGLSIVGDQNFANAHTKMRSLIEETLKQTDMRPVQMVDVEMDLGDISWELVEGIEYCKPYGIGNPSPIFCSSKVRVIGMNTVGDGKHLRLTLQSTTGKIAKMIGFKFGTWIEQLHFGDVIDVLYEVCVNEWNGNRELQGRIVDIKKNQI